LLKRKLKNKVQYYNSDAPDDLDFHKPGRVTVIHKMSMKGLEFETVFVVELDAVNIEGAELDETKMAFYVAFSRPLERLFLCSSNLKDPDLLILDEASASLDSETEKRIQQSLFGGSNGHEQRITIAVAHRLATIRNADEIVAMVDGAIVERGTHNELLDNDNVYASQWSIQTGELSVAEV